MRLRIILSSALATITFGLIAWGNQGAMVKQPYDAPAISSIDQDGNAINFSDVYKKGITVVFFYPKADTPGCTAQSCSLRDAYADLKAKGVQVLGVSVDKPANNKAFKEKFMLPYPLVCDPEGEVLRAFKVSKIPALGLATRQCFIIKDGKVIWHDPSASKASQADDVRAVLKELGV